jgi:hypothetical protein
MNNKKGQEMSVATLVLIVIGIVVLVMLILGFSMGWQNLWAKVNIFGGGSNVETVIQSCKLAASSSSQFSYCSEFKQVTIDGKKQYINCADERVTGVENPLTCTGNEVKDYCASLAGGKAGAALEAVKIVIVNKEACGKYSDLFVGKTCDALVGVWGTTACAGGKADLTSKVSDMAGKDANTICCAK